MLKVPEKLVSTRGELYLFKGESAIGDKLVYQNIDGSSYSVLTPEVIEKKWPKAGRKTPSTQIVSQGRWTCAAASTAMLMGLSHYEVKRAFVKCGWNNDDRGLTHESLVSGVRLLGDELVGVSRIPDGEACLVTLKSLNVPGLNHMVCWNGQELLDPNYGDPTRKWWGVEWSPESLDFLYLYQLKSTIDSRAPKGLPEYQEAKTGTSFHFPHELIVR